MEDKTIQTGVPFGDYLRIDAVNASSLKYLARSPAYYLWRQSQQVDSEAMQTGRAAHAAVFEPDVFRKEFVTWHKRRQGKEWDAFQEAHGDRNIITEAQRDKAVGIAHAVRKHPVSARLLANGEAESTLTWIDAVTGRKCKARVDWFGAALVDLKTTQDPGVRFSAAVVRYDYHLQMAFYSDGLEAVTGKKRPVKLIAVDQNAPHEVVVYNVPEDVLAIGRARYRELLDLLIECESSGHWPGIAPDEQTLILPEWAYENPNLDLTFDGAALNF